MPESISCSMKGNQRSTSDRISNLPSHVAENILKHLPLREAVRTSVLSSKWRYKWVTLPQLVFNDQFFLKVPDNEKLKAVIYQVLLLHQGPLMKFTLRYPPFGICPDINNWIIILLTKNIQEFSFFLSDVPHHEIPHRLYSLLQLRELNLSSCVFKPPPTFKGFSRLVDLNFYRVNISSEMCGLFISNCPLLQRLTLRYCTDFDSLEIHAPNLKYFDFVGIFVSISLENTALLAEISVTLRTWGKRVKEPEEADCEWVKFFPSLPAIEYMLLDSSFLEILYSNPVQDPVMEFLQAQDFSNFSLSQLREVEIRHFSGAEPETHFVKILLAHSKVLDKMVILHEHGISDEKAFAMSKELIRFPRASAKAEVVFIEN